jgi:hypothetical protein
MTERHPVFIDYTGRRWRRVRRTVLIGGVVSTLLGLGVAVSLFLSEGLLPELHPATLVPETHPMTRKQERQRTTLRRLLDRAIARTGAVPAGRHPPPVPRSPVTNTKTVPAGRPIIAGFHVSWDDNSTASVDTNIAHMDWVVGEWAFVDPSGDSLDINIDGRVIARDTLEPPGHRAQLILMVSNYAQSARDFSSSALGRMLSHPLLVPAR